MVMPERLVDPRMGTDACGAPECELPVLEHGLCALHAYRDARQLSRDRREQRSRGRAVSIGPTSEQDVLRGMADSAPPPAIVKRPRIPPRPRTSKTALTRPEQRPTQPSASPPSTSDPFLTTSEVARLVGVATTTIQRAVVRGVVLYRRTPGGHLRVRRQDVDEWIQRLTDPEGRGVGVTSSDRACSSPPVVPGQGAGG